MWESSLACILGISEYRAPFLVVNELKGLITCRSRVAVRLPGVDVAVVFVCRIDCLDESRSYSNDRLNLYKGLSGAKLKGLAGKYYGVYRWRSIPPVGFLL